MKVAESVVERVLADDRWQWMAVQQCRERQQAQVPTGRV
jgi:hypothetical protein